MLDDSAGDNGTAMITVFVDPTVAGPTESSGSADLGQSVTFSAVASFGTGNYTYNWSGLPTGCGGTRASISCTPTSVGPFSISVDVIDSNGFSVTSGVVRFVSFADPTAAFPVGSPSSGQVDAGQSVTFTTSASLGTTMFSSYYWSGLPGGCAGNQSTVMCSGPKLPAGIYRISVTVTDSNNYTSTASCPLSFVVDSDPSVTVPSATRPSADVGQNATFAVTATLGSGDYSFVWKGLPAGCSGTTDTARCLVTTAITLPVQVEVTDSNGFAVTSGSMVFATYSDPTASLSADRIALDSGLPVTLYAGAALGSGGYTYAWSGLPIGCSGISETIVCSPTESGRYSLTVNVTDSNGVWVRSSPVALVVAPALSGNISPSPSSPAPGQEVTFTADVSGGTGPISYSWAFGDGATDSGATVSYTFGSAGTYNVKLWVNDSVGGSTRITLNLTVGEPTGPFGSLSADLGIGLILVVVIAIAVVASIMMPRSRRNDDPVAKRPGGSQS